MTIEEIKEWRNNGGSYHCMANEIVDTLPAEVATLEKHNAYADQYNAVQDLHLTIATEALEMIVTDKSDVKWGAVDMLVIARTALERIKE